jgi:hypothetical protein
MYTSVKTITPAEAVEILDTKNLNNRPISQFTVDRYTQEMKAGRWKLNGEAIIFGKSGRLLDGQHRLKACIQANKPFQSVVVLGAEDHVFDTIDDGKVRGLGDVLAIRGEVNAPKLAAGLRFVWDYATGVLHGQASSRAVISSKQLLEKLLDKHQGIRKSAQLHSMLTMRPGGLLVTPSVAIGLHYLFTLINEPKADSFFIALQSGAGLKDGDPVLTLRNRLISGAREKGGKVMTREAVYSYTVYAWNAYAADRQLRSFSLKLEQGLPEIDGLSREFAAQLLD